MDNPPTNIFDVPENFTPRLFLLLIHLPFACERLSKAQSYIEEIECA